MTRPERVAIVTGVGPGIGRPTALEAMSRTQLVVVAPREAPRYNYRNVSARLDVNGGRWFA